MSLKPLSQYHWEDLRNTVLYRSKEYPLSTLSKVSLYLVIVMLLNRTDRVSQVGLCIVAKFSPI